MNTSLMLLVCVLVFTVGVGALFCTSRSPRKGFCAIESTHCCESYGGNECKKELSQNHTIFSHPLEFLPDSLIMSYLPNNQSTLLCVSGFGIPDGMSFRPYDTKGLYLCAMIWNSDTGKEDLHTCVTAMFPGTITRAALREAIFCLELDRTKDQLAIPSNYLTLMLVTLPTDPSSQPVVYAEETMGKYIPVCSIPSAHILTHNNCFKWRQQRLSTNQCASKHTKTATAEVRHSPISTANVPMSASGPEEPRAENPIWIYLAFVFITVYFITLSCFCIFGAIVYTIHRIQRKPMSSCPHTCDSRNDFSQNMEQNGRCKGSLLSNRIPADLLSTGNLNVTPHLRPFSRQMPSTTSLLNSPSITSLEPGGPLTGASTPNLDTSFSSESSRHFFLEKHYSCATYQKQAKESKNRELSCKFSEISV